jgi:hypothetical protein
MRMEVLQETVQQVHQVQLPVQLRLTPVAVVVVQVEKVAQVLLLVEPVAQAAVVLEQIQAMILLQVQLIAAVVVAAATRWIASYHLTAVQV